MKLEEKRGAEEQHFANIRKQWQEMVKWHQTNFPGVGDLLIQQVALPEKQLKEREQVEAKAAASQEKSKETLSNSSPPSGEQSNNGSALENEARKGTAPTPRIKMIQDFNQPWPPLANTTGQKE